MSLKASLPFSKTRRLRVDAGLRLQEVGMIKTTPEKLMARGTDWRFLNEMKKEMKT